MVQWNKVGGLVTDEELLQKSLLIVSPGYIPFLILCYLLWNIISMFRCHSCVNRSIKISSWTLNKEVSMSYWCTTGWSIGTVTCNMSLMYWKKLNRTYNKLNSIVHIGRFDNSPLFYIWAKQIIIEEFLHIVRKFKEISWLYRVSKINWIVQNRVHFRPFLKVLADKLMPHSQISFKSWVYNVDLDLNMFLLKSTQWWLEKS